MNIAQIAKTTVIALALLLGPSWAGSVAVAQTKPDNTGVNKRDRDPSEATADDQKMNAADRTLAAKIRSSIMAGQVALHVRTKRKESISQDGTVTLKGPVRSDEEVKSIVAKATDVTGNTGKVINQMSIAPTAKP